MFKNKSKLITDETDYFIYLRDCLLQLFASTHSTEDILCAWISGCDKILELLEELE